jgi:hypothetical protein
MKPEDTQIIVSKELRKRIKIASLKAGLMPREYLDKLVPKEP